MENEISTMEQNATKENLTELSVNYKAGDNGNVLESDEHRQPEPMQPWEPLDGGYGWVIVVLCLFCLILFATISQLGVLLLPLQEYFGVSKSVITGINTVHTGVGRLTGVFVGQCLHQFGGKAVIGTATLLMAAGYFISSFVTNTPLLYLTFGLLPGISCTCFVTTAMSYPQQYFTKKRSIAAGIAGMGFGLGSFIWSPLLNKLIEEYGWQVALRIESAIFLVLGALITIFLRTPAHKDPLVDCFFQCYMQKSQKDTREKIPHQRCCSLVKNLCNFDVLRNYIFIVYCLFTFLMSLGLFIDLTYLPVRAQMLGIDSQAAAFQASVQGIALTIAGPVMAAIGNAPGVRSHRDVYFAVVMFIFSVINFASTFTTSSTPLFVFAAFMGICSGFTFSMVPVLVTDIVGWELNAMAIGNVTVAYGLGNIVLHPVVGWLLDETGDPQSSFYLAAVSLLLSGFTMICVSVMLHRKRRNVYNVKRKMQEASNSCA